MKITEATFRVCRNLGNYETVHYSVTVCVGEDEKLDFEPIKKAIDKQHIKLYGKQEEHITAARQTGFKRQIVDYSDDPRSTYGLIVDALSSGRVTLSEVEQSFSLTSDARKALLEI